MGDFRSGGLARAIVFLLLLVGALPAEDRVTLVPEGAVDPVVLLGTVEDYTGESLIIRRTGAPNDRHPASAIRSVETFRVSKHEQGLEQFEAGEIALADVTLQAAVREEARGWVQREILSGLVRCATRQGDPSAAAKHFLRITSEDPTTRHWNVAPLTWAPTALGEGQMSLAREWLNSKLAPDRLMAASWLLLDPVYGQAAESKLKELSRDPNRVVSALSKTQLWRLHMLTPLNEVELEKWKHDVRVLPQPLRAGPHFLVGRALLQRREPTQAAAEFLWLPLVYREPEDLAARAMLEAAKALASVGQNADAMALHERMDRDYHWSPSAAESRQARSVLSPPADSDEN